MKIRDRRGVNLRGKVVVACSPPYYGTSVGRLFHCQDGSGCSPDLGTAVFGAWSDGEGFDRIERHEVEGIATDDEGNDLTPKAAKTLATGPAKGS